MGGCAPVLIPWEGDAYASFRDKTNGPQALCPGRCGGCVRVLQGPQGRACGRMEAPRKLGGKQGDYPHRVLRPGCVRRNRQGHRPGGRLRRVYRAAPGGGLPGEYGGNRIRPLAGLLGQGVDGRGGGGIAAVWVSGCENG